MTSVVLTTAILCVLAAAAWHDVATRLIPDSLCLALLCAAVALRFLDGWSALLVSLGTTFLLFVLLLLLAMRGLLGGGDVKLAAALAAGLPPAATWDFTVLTLLIGGMLGLGYIVAARWIPQPARSASATPHLLARVAVVEARRIRRRGPLPYAVAIAAAGAAVLLDARGI